MELTRPARPSVPLPRRHRGARLAAAVTTFLAGLVVAAAPASAWPQCGW